MNGNPFKIDTTGIIFEGSIFVIRMVWKKPATAGERLVILNSNGRTLWGENAYTGGNGISIEQDINTICNGIIVDTIDSGTLYIYWR